MIKKSLFMIFLLLLVTSLGAYAQCVEPTDNMRITEDTTFCAGQYELNSGVIISADEVTLDCNGASISGSINGAGILVDTQSRVTIKDCDISNFQVGIQMMSSVESSVTGNSLSSNEVGIAIDRVMAGVFDSNNFLDNMVGISFLDECDGNTFSDNDFDGGDMGGFIFTNPQEYPTNSYSGNLYHGTTSGPQDYETDYVYVSASQLGVNNQEPEDIDEDEEDADEQEPEEPEEPEVTQPKVKTGTQEFQLPANTEVLDSKGNTVDSESILNKIYESLGLDDKNLKKDLEESKEIEQNLVIEKWLKVDYDANTTTVTTTIRSKKDMKNLQVIEEVPKCLSEDAAEIMSLLKGHEVIDSDPLIVWNYEDVKEGEEIEISYRMNKVFRRSPTTLAISDETDSKAEDEALCGTKENPVNLFCADCTHKKKNKYSLLVPLLLIPLIVVIFIYFGRFEKKPQQ